MTLRIGFVLGRPVSSASVLRETCDILRGAGTEVDVRVVEARDAIEAQEAAHRELSGLETADLVVLRAVGAVVLRAARAVEEAGVPCCNSVAASLAAHDKGEAAHRLQAAGIATPRTFTLESWEEVEARAPGRRLVVKPTTGSDGRGVLFVPALGAGPRPPWPGPYLVQDRVDHDGRDRKLYVVGHHVAGVLRRWPPRTVADKLGRAFEPDAALAALARQAGAALGLELHGIDVVVDGDGRPSVVDVNAFPGYKGVPGAPQRLAEYLLAKALRREVVA